VEDEVSEKRFFYRDPLEAAYMAKHFGMKFSFDEYRYQWNSEKLEFSATPILKKSHSRCGSPNKILSSMASVSIKFYIHPDSLHLLEPQVRDLVFSGDDLSNVGMFDLQNIEKIGYVHASVAMDFSEENKREFDTSR
jgi:hypothetical protein